MFNTLSPFCQTWSVMRSHHQFICLTQLCTLKFVERLHHLKRHQRTPFPLSHGHIVASHSATMVTRSYCYITDSIKAWVLEPSIRATSIALSTQHTPHLRPWLIHHPIFVSYRAIPDCDANRRNYYHPSMIVIHSFHLYNSTRCGDVTYQLG